MTSYHVRIEDAKSRFSASHFLVDHNKCSRIHGHNYNVSVELTGPLNKDYFVVDFFDLKQRLRKITEKMDHHVLIPGKSNDIEIEEKSGQILVNMKQKHYEFPKSDVIILPLKATTAELISKYIYDFIKEEFPDFPIIVEVSESKASIAKYGDF